MKIHTKKLPVPLHDRVLVERDEADSVSPGGIILTHAEDVPNFGTVLAVGPGKEKHIGTVTGGSANTQQTTVERIPVSVKAGDRVVWGKYSGTDLELNGKKVVIMREEDILAIL